ncbi:hypothetical protein [Streptomyces hoynatensis]|uniref:Uncharacterized protein n=1 Tax=Streptomyces hoynatensis TaxID=1141874 RepID=A0A3A9ZCG5_9ACTN|nr:hypothetical protein [Streptomyces hoynatensis]RKN45554.1 hypothetical protein D7294_03470 [Streptomyces hoynatensis]
MTEWVPTFDYPGGGEWQWLDVRDLPEAAERIARRVADRGGRRGRRYAREIYRELTDSWAQAAEAGTEPVVAYVPQVRREAPPAVPASIQVQRYAPDHARTVAAVMERQRVPVEGPGISYLQADHLAAVELPAGRACRLHQAILADTGFGGQTALESVNYWVLPGELGEDILMLTALWAQDSVPGMVELADAVAASLTLVPRGSGEEAPRPVLDPGRR